MMKIYHNPRCRKSREALAILEDKGIKPEIVLYLQEPPTRAELQAVLKKLDMLPSQLVRTEEPLFKDTYKGKELSETEWLDVLLEYPKLMQRPIVVKGDKAVLGRPPEQVLELL